MTSTNETEPVGQQTAPTALVSWAHANTDWGGIQIAEWEQTVKAFTDLLRANGVAADLDLFHFSDTSSDWTRWGPHKARVSDFVIVAMSEAWAQRWSGTNAPTIGAGATAEADVLKGIFGKDQSEFQRKTLIALLPGVPTNTVPEDLYRLNRFRVAELTRNGIDDLLRAIFEAPKHVPGPVGPRPTFGSPAVVPVHAATPFESSASAEYLSRLLAVSDERRQHRRRGAGLSDGQVQSTLEVPPRVPAALHGLERGQLRIMYGALGSGKSDTAEEWHRSTIRGAMVETGAAVPVWVAIDDLGAALEPHVLAEVGLAALGHRGVDVVVDGLDERTDKASALLRQAGEFVKKWPLSRVVLTTRSRPLASNELLVEVPLLSESEASALMARVAGRRIADLGAQLENSVRRPLFALMVAQRVSAVEGATGIHEVIDRVVEEVVSRENYNLFSELCSLAVATIRAGGAVDPARIASADVAAKIRSSPLVVTTGRKCAFALATFEQWFAAHAALDGLVAMDEILATLATFNRWRYVLAIIAATGDPARADATLAALASWNPGAASWVVDEMTAGGLSRALPDVGPNDWEPFGQRVRTAIQAWIDGLGPLGDCFGPCRRFGVRLDDLAVAVKIGAPQRVTLTWTPRFLIPNQPLPPVVDHSVLVVGSRQRPYELSMVPLPTAANAIWQITRDQLASELTHSFLGKAIEIGRAHHGVACEEARVYQAAVQAMESAPPGFTGNLDVERLYPAADIVPSLTHPFGGFSTEAMLRYSVAVISAAMHCYYELSNWVTPRFGRALPLRGLMPVEFFGSMFYETDQKRSAWDYPGPAEPGFSWMFRPLGCRPGSDVDPNQNRVSLTVNDDERSDDMTSDTTWLYNTFRDYIESHPEYEPFARPFASTHGHISIFHRTPATMLAVRWLWQDLESLGFVNGPMPPDI